MLKPFTVIVAEAGRKAQDTSTARKTKIKESINRFYSDMWMRYMWHEITVIDRSISVASGVSEVRLPKDIAMIHCITERTSDILLQPNSPYIFQAKYVSDRATNAKPQAYVKAGFSPLDANPSDNTKLTVVSSSASDTSQTITIRGKTTGGVIVTEDLSLNGTTEVDSTNTFDKDEIYEISLDSRAAGTITIKDGDGTSLDTIDPNDYNNRYDIIELQSPTDAAKTLYLTGKKRFIPLINDADMPLFDVCDGMVNFAAGEIYEELGKFQQGALLKKQAYDYVESLIVESRIYDEASRQDTMPYINYIPEDYPMLAGESGERTL